MSRVGRRPIDVPDEVKVTIEGRDVKVDGPRGSLSFSVPSPITVEMTDSVITCHRPSDARSIRSLHGVTRSIIANMVEGVSKGFEKTLSIEGLGYRAKAEGRAIQLSLGLSHPVLFEPPEGVELEVVRDNQIVVRGIDKQQVGEVAAQIRRLRPPEPYKGKGIRYSDERVKLKPGKAGV